MSCALGSILSIWWNSQWHSLLFVPSFPLFGMCWNRALLPPHIVLHHWWDQVEEAVVFVGLGRRAECMGIRASHWNMGVPSSGVEALVCTLMLMSLDFHGNGKTKLGQSMENKCVNMAILGRSCVRVGLGHLCAVNQSFKSAKIRLDYTIKQIIRHESWGIEGMTVSCESLVEWEGMAPDMMWISRNCILKQKQRMRLKKTCSRH